MLYNINATLSNIIELYLEYFQEGQIKTNDWNTVVA